MGDKYLTVEEVARELKLNPETVYRWLRSGKLIGEKFGDLWRIRESEVKGIKPHH